MTHYDPFAYGEVHLDPNQSKGEMPADDDDLLFAPSESMQPSAPADSSWSLVDDDNDDFAPSVSSLPSEGEVFGGAIFGDPPPGNEVADHGRARELPLGEPALGFSEAGDAPPDPYAEADCAPFQDEQLGSENHEIDHESGSLTEFMPSPDPAASSAEAGVVRTRPNREVRRRRQPVSATAVSDELAQEASKVKKRRIPGRRRRTALTVALPIMLCAGGGAVGSWFWAMQGNPVMASIIVAASIVSGLFARLFLRG